MGSAAGWCTVQGCPGRQYDVYFKFPKDEALCDAWLKVVKSPKSKKPILLGPSSRICSLHFTYGYYHKIIEDGGLILEHLKPTSIPSMFPWTESWPLNKKKKKVEGGADDKESSESQKKADIKKTEQTFACPSCDYMTNTVDHSESHRRSHEKQHRYSCDRCSFSTDSLDVLDIHLSRDHENSITELGASVRPQKLTRFSIDTATSSTRKSVRQEALAPKGNVKESGSSGSLTGLVLLDNYDSSADDSRSELSRRTRSISSSILKSASTTKLSNKSPGTQLDDTIKSGTSQKVMNMDPSHAVKHEVDKTPIILNSSSIGQEKPDQVSDKIVKKEVEASGGNKKERKVIWVVSGEADD